MFSDFEGDDAIRISTPSEIVEGDDPQIICAVTKLDHGKNISWVKVVNGEAIPLESDGKLIISIVKLFTVRASFRCMTSS